MTEVLHDVGILLLVKKTIRFQEVLMMSFRIILVIENKWLLYNFLKSWSCESGCFFENTFITGNLPKLNLIFRSSRQGCSIKKLFLKISQNSQENSSARALLIKREALTQVLSCEFCKIFKNTFFTEHLRATASKF